MRAVGNVYGILEEKNLGKSVHGRLRRRWKDN
jgi:hypothetical protein